MKDIFSEIYHTNFWKDKESVSGQGSNLKQTETIRKVLPIVFENYGIRSILDIPCGDFYWFEKMNWAKDVEVLHYYIGADIVPEIIEANRKRLGRRTYLDFQVLDATTDELPKVDLILCRDMLGHFTNKNVMKALKNFRASGSKYLLATTFPGRNPNADLDFDGQWRPIDLEALRYGLGKADMIINEKCTEAKGAFADKSLGLWRIN